MHTISETLDAHINANQTDGMPSLIESLENALKIAVASIRQLEVAADADNTQNITIEMDLPALEAIFRALLASFGEYNPKAVQPFIEKLSKSLPKQQLDPINHRLDQFDFEGSREATLKLARKLNVTLQIRSNPNP